MTDKELRKLSRLELLELLLKESRENEKLRAELNKLKSENSIEKTTERLEETAEQFDTSLQSIGSIVSVMQKLVSNDVTESSEDTDNTETSTKKKMSADADIYRRLMLYFVHNTGYLDYLPDELRKDISTRLTQLLKEAKADKTDSD